MFLGIGISMFEAYPLLGPVVVVLTACAIHVAWTVLALRGRWEAEPNRIDCLARVLGVCWAVVIPLQAVFMHFGVVRLIFQRHFPKKDCLKVRSPVSALESGRVLVNEPEEARRLLHSKHDDCGGAAMNLDNKSRSEHSPAGRCRMRWIVLILGTIAACGCADHRADLQTQAAQQSEQMQRLEQRTCWQFTSSFLVSIGDLAAVDHCGVDEAAILFVEILRSLKGFDCSGRGDKLTWVELAFGGLVWTHFVSRICDLWLFTF